jgi:sensor histidine kinase YesM
VFEDFFIERVVTFFSLGTCSDVFPNQEKISEKEMIRKKDRNTKKGSICGFETKKETIRTKKQKYSFHLKNLHLRTNWNLIKIRISEKALLYLYHREGILFASKANFCCIIFLLHNFDECYERVLCISIDS